MLHFRAMILMSHNKDLYSYYHEKFDVILYYEVSKKRQNNFINLHVNLLVEQRPLYKHF